MSFDNLISRGKIKKQKGYEVPEIFDILIVRYTSPVSIQLIQTGDLKNTVVDFSNKSINNQ